MTVWLIIPAHGRAHVSAVAFAGIRWMLDTLAERGIEARAVVIAEDENLSLAESHGFDTVWRENRPLGRKWNDGYEHAGFAGATHMIPCGSDDWVHPDLICAMLDAQSGDAIGCTSSSAAVAPDGSEISTLTIPYPGGDGIRLLPASLLESVKFRPTMDKRNRAIDGATFDLLSKRGDRPIEWACVETNALHIVDFKSETNLTDYAKFAAAGYVTETLPLSALAEHYPSDLVALAEALYR